MVATEGAGVTAPATWAAVAAGARMLDLRREIASGRPTTSTGGRRGGRRRGRNIRRPDTPPYFPSDAC